MYFSKLTNGFYDAEIHKNNMPSDAVEISDEDHARLLGGQSEGKMIAADDNGYPILSDHPAPSNDELKVLCKAQAKQLLIDTDWSQQSDVALVLTNKADFDSYRSTVRGLFLRPVPDPVFPEVPEATWRVE